MNGTEKEGNGEKIPERAEIIALLNELHPDKLPKINTAETAATYAEIAKTLSQVLTELLTYVSKNKRLPSEFSETWQRKNVHLIHINNAEKKLSAAQYVLASPGAFLRDTAVFLKEGKLAPVNEPPRPEHRRTQSSASENSRPRQSVDLPRQLDRSDADTRRPGLRSCPYRQNPIRYCTAGRYKLA